MTTPWQLIEGECPSRDGRRFIGIEREAAYADISRRRLTGAELEAADVTDLV